MEGLTLALDASTYEGSVALVRGGRVVAERTVAMRGEHEERLMPAVAQVLAEIGTGPRDLDHVVCGSGPGSFTSLRIAASIAKGIAAGVGIPLYEVSSLALCAAACGAGRWLVSLDAMRGELYACAYESDGLRIAEILPPTLVSRADGDALAASVGATLVEGCPHARAVARLLDHIATAGPVEVAGWEPSYGRLAEAQVRWEATHGRPLGK